MKENEKNTNIIPLDDEEMDLATGGFALPHPKGGVIITPATPACANYESNSKLDVKVCATCVHADLGFLKCRKPAW